MTDVGTEIKAKKSRGRKKAELEAAETRRIDRILGSQPAPESPRQQIARNRLVREKLSFTRDGQRLTQRTTPDPTPTATAATVVGGVRRILTEAAVADPPPAAVVSSEDTLAVLERIEASIKGLGAAEEMLKGASPLEKASLLQQLQEDRNLQALVAAGMMKWSDVLKPNPTKGSPGHVDGVATGSPVIDQPKLADLRNKLLVIGKQAANTELERTAFRAKERVTAGYTSTDRRGDPYPGMKVWSGPRYMPGALSKPDNVLQ